MTGDSARQVLAEISADIEESKKHSGFADPVNFNCSKRVFDRSPRLMAALTAVLDLHPRVVFTGFERALLFISELPNVGGEICSRCNAPYPCDEVRAVAAALQEQP